MKAEIIWEGFKSLLAVIGAVISAIPWLAILTGAYIILQAAYLLRKWWREEKGPFRQ